jgi:hypothetical protein
MRTVQMYRGLPQRALMTQVFILCVRSGRGVRGGGSGDTFPPAVHTCILYDVDLCTHLLVCALSSFLAVDSQHQSTAGTLSFAQFKKELAEYFVTTGHGAARPPGEKQVGFSEESGAMRPVREARLALALLVRERWPELHEQIQAADKSHSGQVCGLVCGRGKHGRLVLWLFLGAVVLLTYWGVSVVSVLGPVVVVWRPHRCPRTYLRSVSQTLA